MDKSWLRLIFPLAGFAFTIAGFTLPSHAKSIFDDLDTTPAQTQPATPATPATPETPKAQPHPGPAPTPTPTTAPSNPPTATPQGQPGPAPLADVSNVKLDPPSAATKAKVLKIVKQIYEKEYADSAKSSKRSLADQLLSEADEIKSNFGARFVILQEADAAASTAGDVALAHKAVQKLQQGYKIDSAAVLSETISKLANAGADEAKLTTWAQEVIEDRIDADDYQGAKQVARAVSTRMAKSPDQALRGRFKTSEGILAEADRIRPAIEKLQTAPDDAAANLSFGKFLCSARRDWQKGVAHLARGSDIKLKAVAQADIAGPTESHAQFKLGTEWWDLGRDSTRASFQPALHERAAYWYEKSLPGLNGLDKVMADKRMSETAVPYKILGEKIEVYNGQSANYAKYKDGVFDVGIGDYAPGWGKGAAGIEVSGMKTVRVSVARTKEFHTQNLSSFAGAIVDYHTAAGYTKRVALGMGIAGTDHGGDVAPGFGCDHAPDQFVDLGKEDSYVLRLYEYAPADWDGQAWFIIGIENTGSKTSLVVKIAK